MQKSIKSEDIKSLEDCYILGYLAKDEKVFPAIGEEQQCVTYLKKNPEYILFYVKPVSKLPKKLNEIPGPWENSLFIGFEKGLETIQMPPEYWYLQDIKEKKKYIIDKLSNKLILFKPYIKKEEKNNRNEIYYRNLYIYDVEEVNMPLGKMYIPVPSPNMSCQEFERAILQQSNIDFPLYNTEMEDPQFVICEDYIYYNLKWSSPSKNKRVINGIGDIKKIRIPDDFYDNIVYKVNDELVFVDEEYLEESLKKRFELEGINIFHKYDKELYKNAIKSEWAFLQKFKQIVINDGLCYKDVDLYNFHISVKTNPLTIISGMAGTGKTTLAVCYAKALGLSEENYIVVPISPAYTEPADIIGYLNTSKEEYISSETGIADLLKKAQDNPDQMFMIIFDEMNLSQVEYWFSPFISILEMEEQNRKLVLYNKYSRCKNENDYPPVINIGNNVIFVGTVNIDETTKDFSDRLLDRANLIAPQRVSFIEMREMFKNRKKEAAKAEVYVNSSYMNLWRRNLEIPTDVFKECELKFLDRLHECIHNVDKQKGISYRTLQSIASYILNIPEDEKGETVISRGTAFDIQVKQRILTKVKGHQEQYGRLIGVIDKGEIRDSELYNILTDEASRKISDFKYSIEELKRKAEEMYYNGYSS
jgi:hypothetical protein